MSGTSQPSFKTKTVRAIAGGSYAAGTHDSAVIDMLGYEWAEIIVDSKLNQATGTLDVTARDGDASDQSDDAAITGAAFTQITTVNDTALYSGELYVPIRKRYLTVRAIVATAACEFGVIVKLYGPKAAPVESPTPAFTISE